MKHVKIAGKEYPVKITYKMALIDLPKQDIYLLSLFEGENISKLMERIQLSNHYLIEIMNFLIFNGEKSDEEIAILLDESENDVLEEFREALWDTIVNFTPARLREPLSEALEKIVNEMQTKLAEGLESMVQEDLNQKELKVQK